MSRVDFEDAGFQKAHWRLAIGATTGYICDGYTLGVVGIALAGAQKQLSLTPAWLGALGGASLVGLLLGALFCGPATDRWGRRPIFAYNMVFFFGLSLLQLVARSPVELWVVRFLLGVVLGTDYVVVKALLAEFMPRRHRGRALSLMGTAWAVGYALAYVAGFLVKDSSAGAWRYTLASSAILALISLPLRVSAPESPLWLRLKGRSGEAQRVIEEQLGSGYELAGGLEGASGARAAPGVARAIDSPGAPAWRELLLGRHRRQTFVASTVFVCLVVPYFAVSTFIPQVMLALHVRGNEVGGLIYILALMVGSIAGFLVVDGFSRRAFVIGSFSITAVALLLCASSAALPDALVIVAFAVFSCVLSAAQAQVYVYLPELFPTAVRGFGLGIAVAFSRLGAAVGTSLLPVCVVLYGVQTALYVCVAILAIGGITCFRWAPETRHVRLARL